MGETWVWNGRLVSVGDGGDSDRVTASPPPNDRDEGDHRPLVWVYHHVNFWSFSLLERTYKKKKKKAEKVGRPEPPPAAPRATALSTSRRVKVKSTFGGPPPIDNVCVDLYGSPAMHSSSADPRRSEGLWQGWRTVLPLAVGSWATFQGTNDRACRRRSARRSKKTLRPARRRACVRQG